MNLNKNFFNQVIKYLISKGVTVHDVLDAFHEQFEYHEQASKLPDVTWINMKQPSVEESSTPCTAVDSNRDLCRKVEEKTENPTPMTRVIRPYTKSKKPEEHKVVEESSPKTKMMLVNGRMTKMKVSDTDLVQSSIIEKPEETLETKTKTLETKSNTEKATESVTNAKALNGNNVTAVILDTPNPDAIRKDKNDIMEKALKKFITSTTGIEYEEPKKDKKPKETKSDLTVLEVCQKMNVTTHELREMVNCGDFPQPDCDKKWSVKLLKKEGII